MQLEIQSRESEGKVVVRLSADIDAGAVFLGGSQTEMMFPGMYFTPLWSSASPVCQHGIQFPDATLAPLGQLAAMNQAELQEYPGLPYCGATMKPWKLETTPRNQEFGNSDMAELTARSLSESSEITLDPGVAVSVIAALAQPDGWLFSGGSTFECGYQNDMLYHVYSTMPLC